MCFFRIATKKIWPDAWSARMEYLLKKEKKMIEKKSIAKNIEIKSWKKVKLDKSRLKEGISKMREGFAEDAKKEMIKSSTGVSRNKGIIPWNKKR